MYNKIIHFILHFLWQYFFISSKSELLNNKISLRNILSKFECHILKWEGKKKWR